MNIILPHPFLEKSQLHLSGAEDGQLHDLERVLGVGREHALHPGFMVVWSVLAHIHTVKVSVQERIYMLHGYVAIVSMLQQFNSN